MNQLNTPEIEPVIASISVQAAPLRAFEFFTAGMSRWWLPTQSASPTRPAIPQDDPVKVVPSIELRLNGRWYERATDGSECDWGRVLAWEPPKRLVLAWQIDAKWHFDPMLLTEVEVRFDEQDSGATRTYPITRLELIDRYSGTPVVLTYVKVRFLRPPLFQLNRALLKLPSRLAAGIIKKTASRKGVLPGIFTALHTFGRDLKWNVHIHLSVTCGGLMAGGERWKRLYFVKAQIAPMWRYEITTLLRQSYESLVLPDALKALCPTRETFSRWLDSHYGKPWIVHFARPSKSHVRNIHYLGRYIKRPPLSLSRLEHYDGTTVAFRYLDHRSGQHRTARYDTEEFIGRFVQHIPDKHFRMINFYGFLANRVRGRWLPKVYALLEQEVERVKTIRYRDLQRHAFGVDPLICVLCGSPLRLSGITRGKSAARLRAHHEALACAKIVV